MNEADFPFQEDLSEDQLTHSACCDPHLRLCHWEEEPQWNKMLPSDGPVGNFVGHFLD